MSTSPFEPGAPLPEQPSAPPTPPAPIQPPAPPPAAPPPPTQQLAGAPAVAASPAAPVVQIDHASKTFDDVVAVEDLSLHVARGTVLGVIGPSGAGKTTTIRMISGAIRPDSGSVRVLGENPYEFDRRTRESIGYMPQLFVLYPDLTAQREPQLHGRAVRHPAVAPRSTASARCSSWSTCGTRVVVGRRRCRAACSAAWSWPARWFIRPTLLILDEPTAGIDPILRTRIWQEIARLRETGVTVLVTTQYVSEAEYCDAVALISEGELIAHATPTDLRRLALGGEVIEVGTHEPLDLRRLPQIPGVASIRQTDARQFLVVAQDAGLANPLINDAVEQAGGTVEFSREYRPTFDEVFAALVTSHAERKAQMLQAAEAAAAQKEA